MKLVKPLLFVGLIVSGTSLAGIGGLVRVDPQPCENSCTCNYSNGSSCSAQANSCNTQGKCASCSCSGSGCAAACVSQKTTEDPPYILLQGEPVSDFTVEHYSLSLFRAQIAASGWTTSGITSSSPSITKTYTGEYDFTDLLGVIAADFGVCYAIDEENLNIEFWDCE